MLLISRIGRTLLLALCLCAGVAQAALPDPVALSWAIERNDVKQVTAWLDEGLDPEYQASQIGSGLMIAAWHGRVEMMALFVERGANPRRANGNGEQPLQLAAWNGHLEAVKWLLDHGALLNRDGNYWGALHYAVFNGHRDLARFLIDRGADVNGRSPNGSTPLMMAAREGREELAGDLLAAGADPKAKSDWGDDALMLAMRYDHYSLGKMISSADEFSAAVKAPKESFGEPVRSASAPSEIEVLLTRIHEAEGEGRPSEELHKKLMEEVSKLRRNAVVVSNARRPMPIPFQSRSLVITAKRGKPGAERAQVVVGKPAVPAAAGKVVTNKAGAIAITPVDQRARQARVAEIMRQIRLYEAQGRPSEDLRRELYEAVEALK
jgi:hypothetical protein